MADKVQAKSAKPKVNVGGTWVSAWGDMQIQCPCAGGACMGRCENSCDTACTDSCTNACTSCSGSCSGGCGSNCTGGCSSGCSGACKGSCKSCGSACSACTTTCTSRCRNLCDTGCRAYCQIGCNTGTRADAVPTGTETCDCSACSYGACSLSCSSNCRGNCSASCSSNCDTSCSTTDYGFTGDSSQVYNTQGTLYGSTMVPIAAGTLYSSLRGTTSETVIGEGPLVDYFTGNTQHTRCKAVQYRSGNTWYPDIS